MSDENTEQAGPTQEVINLNINDARIAEAKEKFKEIDAYVDLEAAKKAKKVLIKMRTTLAEAHKIQKAESLAFGRRLDGEKNRLLVLIAEVEDPISEQLTEIKEKAEREEADRVEKINNEIERIKAFANDRHDLTVEQLEERRATLATIEVSEETFDELTDQAQTFKDEADAKLRIALVNEQERVAEAEKLEAQREEQAAQQKKLDKRQAKMDEEEAERKAKQEERDREKREEQECLNAERQAELDKQAEEQAAAQKKIDDENARLAQEKADKEETERKAREQAEADELAALQAPDIEKLERFAALLDDAKIQLPLETDAAKRVMALAFEKLQATIDYIRSETEKLK